jgi:hypothetical protein
MSNKSPSRQLVSINRGVQCSGTRKDLEAAG